MPQFRFLPHRSAKTMTRGETVRPKTLSPMPMNRLHRVDASRGGVEMGGRDLAQSGAVRRIWEGVTATVVGGLILWSMTSSLSQPALMTERTAMTMAPAAEPTAAPRSASLVAPTTSEAPATPRIHANVSIPVSIPGPTPAAPLPARSLLPYSVPLPSILLYENFSHYRDGEAAGWGPNTFVKTGLDGRNWLVSNVEGTHPVGCRAPLPGVFYFQCRYSAYAPEVTRGIFRFWKEPVASKISFLNGQGATYAIDWVIRYGNDTTRPNPLGSSSLYAKTHYHTITLPDGTANEIGVIQPTGVLRISRDNNVVKVFLDGQAAVTGSMTPMGQLVGFEINVVKAKNGTLSFTEFKIGR